VVPFDSSLVDSELVTNVGEHMEDVTPLALNNSGDILGSTDEMELAADNPHRDLSRKH
jgi:hypothetical protein